MIPAVEASRIHSSLVEMFLDLAGAQPIPIAQLGPDFVLLAKALESALPAQTRGRLTVTVDGTPRGWDVVLPEGGEVGARRVAVVG